MKIRKWIKQIAAQNTQSKRFDEEQIVRFVADEANTFLVSFPRTGSHWLRMLVERYFERPTLVRTFYYPESTDFLLLHTHDMDLDVERRNVIYLYRDPVATIYSQLRYEQEDLNDLNRIQHWANLYARHLDKWLYKESFTRLKTIITYEEMTADLEGTFEKITGHFNRALDLDKLQKVSAQITKDEVKRKTAHDKQVMQLSPRYDQSREEFKQRHGQFVWRAVLNGRSYLSANFKQRTGS